MDEDLSCAICQETFDLQDRVPRMLPCGHTYCQRCLTGLFTRSPVLCPEDRSPISVSSVADLAKNFALLRVVQKKHDSVPRTDTTIKCAEHRKKLEYVCLDDKVKICANCALFGRHKGHNVRAEDEVMREVTIRAECLLEMLQIIENSQAAVLGEQVSGRLDELTKLYLTKRNSIETKLDQFFEDIRGKLSEIEKNTRQTLGKHFELIEESFREMQTAPQQVGYESGEWVQAAKVQLDRLSGASDDPSFLTPELLEGSTDLFQIGEKVLGQLEGLKDLPIGKLEELIQGVNVECAENKLSGLVRVKIGQQKGGSTEGKNTANPEILKRTNSTDETRKTKKGVNESVFEEAMDALRLHTSEIADFSGAGGTSYPDLSERGSQIPPLVASNFCLKSLKFIKNNLSDSTIEELSSVLQDNTVLQTLHIAQNPTGPAALEALAYMLGINSTLREINLMGNPKMTHEYRAKFAAMSNKFRKVYI